MTSHVFPSPHKALVALLLLFSALVACSPASAEDFMGTEMTSQEEAAPFALTDYTGDTVRMADLRGQVVVLTFLYTNCTTVCPITAGKLNDAYERLGEEAQDVSFVAVSVDPANDTPEAARQFSEKWDMTGRWSYLLGSREELAPVWDAYYVEPVPTGGQGHADHAHDMEGAQGEGPIIHQAPVYVIDREGRMRSMFTLPFEPEELVHDVRLLLG